MAEYVWSLADTHCPWCGEEITGSFTHSFAGAGCAAIERRSGGLIGRTVIAQELRGQVEAQAAVIARYRDGWTATDPDSRWAGWWNDATPFGVRDREPMTPAERQVLYGHTEETDREG